MRTAPAEQPYRSRTWPRQRAALGLVVAAVAALAVSCGDRPSPCGTAPSDSPLVATETGCVRGAIAAGVRRFLGIPYAAPPVGGLRWRSPQPAAAWTGVRDATALGPECAGTIPVVGAPSGDGEDCLGLNVVTPDPPPAAAPVMVWIHGGGFTFRDALFARLMLGDRLAAEAGVVVVSFNYRLGQLGFLAHPALTREAGEHPRSGNYGIEDQIAALEWVQRNVAAFGGDPRRVTLFGQSAGGWSVCAHLASPRSRGLFQRAIVQSGVCTVPLPTLAESEAQGERFAAAAGCAGRGDVARCLRELDADAVRRVLPPDPSVFLLDGDWGLWRPNVDGWILPEQIAESFAAGRAARVPAIVGATRDEGTFFVLAAHEYRGVPLAPELYGDRIRTVFGDELAAAVADLYRPAELGGPAAALAEAIGDGILACPTFEAARLLSRWSPVWAYEFALRDAPWALGTPRLLSPGAFHGAELPFVFGVPEPGPFSDRDAELSAVMLGAWTRFALAASPAGQALAWPPFDEDAEAHVRFEARAVPEAHPRSDACAFWRGLDLRQAPRF